MLAVFQGFDAVTDPQVCLTMRNICGLTWQLPSFGYIKNEGKEELGLLFQNPSM